MILTRLLAFLCSPNRKVQDAMERWPEFFLNIDIVYPTLDHYDFYHYNIIIIVI